MTEILLVNFGGPRNLKEVEPFLTELLTDEEVIQTPLPSFLNRKLFTWIAKRRAPKTRQDYEEIGGFSPIYFDTEALKTCLEERLKTKVYTFHRYLPSTHKQTLEELSQSTSPITVLPLFPQFCYSTTGSCARFIQTHLPQNTLNWIPSYADHPAFIKAHQTHITHFLQKKGLNPRETAFLFSFHGIPRSYVQKRKDPYEQECQRTYEGVRKAFQTSPTLLAYQSKFGPGKWLEPYTKNVSKKLPPFELCKKKISLKEYPNLVILPLSFTSDHIETLFEIQKEYLPPIQAQDKKAFCCPCFRQETYWIDALQTILKDPQIPLKKTLSLVR